MKFVKIAVLCLKVFVEAFVPGWAGGTVLWYAFRLADNYCHFGPPSPLSWQSAANDMLPDALIATVSALFILYLKRQEAEQQEKAAREPQREEE